MAMGLSLAAVSLSAAMSGGGTGLLSIPTATILPDRTIHYAHSNGLISVDGNSRLGRRVARQERAVTDQFSVGVAPFLEISGRLTSWYLPDERRANLQDLQGHFKLNLYQGKRVRLTVGGRDVGGESNGISTAIFAVADYVGDTYQVTAGFGKAEQKGKGSALDGPFLGLRYSPWNWLDFMVDHDAVSTQAGLQLRYLMPSKRASLFLKGYHTTNDYQDFVYTVGLTTYLGRSAPAEGLLSGEFSSLQQLLVADYWAGSSSDSMFQLDYADAFSDRLVRDAKVGDCKSTQDFFSYGVPVIQANCIKGNRSTRWRSMWDDQMDPSFWHLQMRLHPVFNYVLGSELGRVDATTSLRAMLNLSMPAGFSSYGVWDASVYDTDDYRPNGAFFGGRIPSGLNEYGTRWTGHVYSGVFVDLLAGQLSSVGGNRFDFQSAKAAAYLLDGRVGLYYDRTKFTDFANIGHNLGKVFVWLKGREYGLEFTRGRFFVGDSGYVAEMRKYIGRTIIGLYYKRGLDTGEEAAGVRVTLSLSPSTAYGNRWLSLRGQSQADFPLESQINRPDGTNRLRPGFLNEFKPASRFMRDTLDNWRSSPYYIEGQ